MKTYKKLETISAYCLSNNIPCDIRAYYGATTSRDYVFVLRFGLSFVICTIDYLYRYVTKFKNNSQPSSVTLTYCLKSIPTLKY